MHSLRGPVPVAFVQSAMGVGGAERLIQALFALHDPERMTPSLVTLVEEGPVGLEMAAAGHAVRSGLSRGRWDLLTVPRLGSALADLGARVVYVTDSVVPLAACGLLRRLRRVPALVVGFHSTGHASDRGKHAVANALALPAADRLVALAPRHRQYLSEWLGLPSSRFEVIPSGVDVNRFAPVPDRRAARRAAGLPEDGDLVGIVAGLRPVKNHGLFLEVAARLAEPFPGARFAIVGDGAERAPLEARARALGLDRVDFLGARADMPRLVAALDVLVLTSHSESLPITLIEALACGVPVVSTDVGSVRDLVRDGETGIVVPPGNAAAFAAALAGLLEDPRRRDAMGRAGRADAERRFSLEGTVRRYEALFASLDAS